MALSHLSLALGHVLEVEDCPALRVVERGRAVEQPQEEERRQHRRHRLQPETPPEGPGMENSLIHVNLFVFQTLIKILYS